MHNFNIIRTELSILNIFFHFFQFVFLLIQSEFLIIWGGSILLHSRIVLLSVVGLFFEFGISSLGTWVLFFEWSYHYLRIFSTIVVAILAQLHRYWYILNNFFGGELCLWKAASISLKVWILVIRTVLLS